MSDYLVFRLYGPMASWGEIAVGESRHSAAYPSKSALIGLLAAALGIRRDDEDAQAMLTSIYRFGVKLLAEGAPLRDYHTVQAPPQQKKMRYRTRRQELSEPSRLGTLLSAREYRCDSLALVAIDALPDAPYSLAEIVTALDRPHFPLYLGRKSCPLAAPLQAQLVAADSVRAALDNVPLFSLSSLNWRSEPVAWPADSDRYGFRLDKKLVRYYWDDGMTAGMGTTMSLVRHDQPTSRRRWQFAPRREHVHLTDEEGGL